MKRFVIKIVGASGQGVNVLGEILAKTLKRSGYHVFAYREYPSLIKGGHATYQLDVSDKKIEASASQVDLVMVLNKQATQWHVDEVKTNGIIFHDIDNPRINSTEAEAMRSKNIKLIYIPAFKLSLEVGGNMLTSNIVSIGALWKILGEEFSVIEEVIKKIFADKPKFLETDLKCITKGYGYEVKDLPPYTARLIKEGEISNDDKSSLHIVDPNFRIKLEIPKNSELQNDLLMTGNEALSLGAITAGVRIHYGYPMTPSSSILAFLAEKAKDTGMIVKQAEDEITAAAMAIGSMFMGTRAMTATSGGGFDLMTEHLSLAGATEIPFVCVLAQRPGPATGMPTWTAQGDLMLSVFSGHGEFARCVVAARNAEDAYYTIQEAFNIAERYQLPVIVLTDKLIAESLFQISTLDQNRTPLERGIVDDESLLSTLTSTDRYKITESGISQRWLPGTKAPDYNANSDEHDTEGNVTEEAEAGGAMIAKRIRKEATLEKELPEPETLTNNVHPEQAAKTYNIIGWGSSYTIVNDLLHYYEANNIKLNYLHIKYLWPLKTQKLIAFLDDHPDTILLEGNYKGQLAQLVRLQTGRECKHVYAKWDGRPFFVEEVAAYLETLNITQ